MEPEATAEATAEPELETEPLDPAEETETVGDDDDTKGDGEDDAEPSEPV